MSIFASQVQRTIEVPFGDRQPDGSPHTVTIQKLSGKQAGRAREAAQMAAVETMKRMGGAEMQREMSTFGDPAKQAELVAQAQADPLNQYDRTELLALGVKAWTYDVPLSREAIEDLSEEAAVFLAREVASLTLPAQDEASRKKTSPSFIAPSMGSDHSHSSTTSADSQKNSEALSPA